MLPITIIGYGGMGRMVERLAPECGCRVVAIIDPLCEKKIICPEAVEEAEVLIDFTNPGSVSANARNAAKLGKNLIIGTTGWESSLEEVTRLGNEIGIVYGANFSVGINLFYQIVETAARLIDAFPEYDPYGVEYHHNRKQDSPSGTARQLAEIVLSHIERKKTPQYDRLNRRVEPEEFHFASVRTGSMPGTHIIGFDSPSDTIEIKHTVRNREGFALGALRAAKWVRNRKGIYRFSEVFPELLGIESVK